MADAVPALAYNYKYNGKEFQDELGLNLYDFHFRQYMQDLGRTTTLDPMAEMFYSTSPYSFLNNNPIRYIDPDGRMSIDGIETHYVNEKGETIANTDDGINDVIVIRKENEVKFTKELSEKVETKEDLNPEVNKELGEKYGYNLDKIKEEGGAPNYPKGITLNDHSWEYGYNSAYNEQSTDWKISGDSGGAGSNYFEGRSIGKSHLKEGKMSIFNPQLKNKQAQNYIKTNQAPKANHRQYSNKPIPLLIDGF